MDNPYAVRSVTKVSDNRYLLRNLGIIGRISSISLGSNEAVVWGMLSQFRGGPRNLTSHICGEVEILGIGPPQPRSWSDMWRCVMDEAEVRDHNVQVTYLRLFKQFYILKVAQLRPEELDFLKAELWGQHRI